MTERDIDVLNSEFKPLCATDIYSSVKNIYLNDKYCQEVKKYSQLSACSFLARSFVPKSHKIAADNFMVIKKIYGFSIISSYLNFDEQKVLDRYELNNLKFMSVKEVVEELGLLQKWSYSKNEQLRNDADNIIQIRSKELKYILSHINASMKIDNGFFALEKYFESVSKYCQ